MMHDPTFLCLNIPERTARRYRKGALPGTVECVSMATLGKTNVRLDPLGTFEGLRLLETFRLTGAA